MIPHSVFAAAVLAMASAHCIYSDTECVCAQAQAGRICLRYYSGSGASTQCETYQCGSGFVCDCAGTEMCDVTDCSLMRTVYRPVGPAAANSGQIVDCQLASQVTCVTPRNEAAPSAHPSASSSPYPSSWSSPPPWASSSPAPSASSSPSASPSTSASATPSASVSPTPSRSPPPSSSSTPSAIPSASPSASASPSNAPIISLGGACTPTSTCETGSGCSCTGFCAPLINIEIRAVGDDSVVPIICNTELGTETPNYSTRGTWFYNGICSDLYFRTHNSQGKWDAMLLALRDLNTNTWYSSEMPPEAGLYGTAINEPPNTDFFTDAGYDFSAWTPVEEHTELRSQGGFPSMLADHGGAIWTVENVDFGPGDQGHSYYRTILPFC